ncbi:hypothetical protein GCM10023321_31280 [Pseudonocardia eucalypti]|uniref:Aminoglycoside phosphotransferase domain-containing protein n=1 Tax=Pseudonocardia eucalypti TaxID=648755 RepID=A0ABP9Q745_9PSEU|nr:hypothetical protein [Pseudonocardia eucalypti]
MTVPEEITTEWLTGALGRAGVLGEGARVVAASGDRIGTGQVARNVRYQLEYAGGEGPRSVVVKSASPDPTSRAVATQMGLYLREVSFYQELAPKLGIRTPRCFHAESDAETHGFVLLMEDLTPIEAVDQLTGFGPDHAALACAQAVGMHAPLWGDDWAAARPWLGGTGGGPGEHAGPEHATLPLVQLVQGFLERYADALKPDTRRVIERLGARVLDVTRPRPGPRTVQHGDYRPDNMLFAGRGGEVPLTVVDWQTVAWGPALVDIAFLLGTSLGVEARRTHERDLLRDYHAGLCAAGVTGYGWDECWADYRRHACYAVTFLAPAAMLVQRTDRGDAMFLAALDRACAQITDLESEQLLESSC